ncbi:MAG: tyrosine-type recombinase/integrase [Streptosporangiales bacterium]|nr:tyrosine-type recombinase/integrase [Streptosporangiales bacterium]
MGNNKGRRRRFGLIRTLASGRVQASYLGPDGRRRYAPNTFERKGDADRFLSLIETQMSRHEWIDPELSAVRLGDYAERWIQERPNLRPRTIDLYGGLLRKHILPYLGGVPLSKMTPALVREWRARLIGKEGVSTSQAAKAYRLLRAVMMTAVDDGVLPRNPCRIRGAGDEKAGERPVLTVAQVFELAERIGKRPEGSVYERPGGQYEVRYARHGVRRRHPESFATRPAAEAALWDLADAGEADHRHDRRFKAMVLLTTFASLRYGEATALRRCDLDIERRVVRVRVAYTQRSTAGPLVLGPPKSAAGNRVVGIPEAIVPILRDHLAAYVTAEDDALVFPGPKGTPLRRSNFNKLTAWPHAVRAIGAEGLHFHDLRHTGNVFASQSGTGLRDLMARMGHDSERAAMIYQHRSRDADRRITNALDEHVRRERKRRDEDDDEGSGTTVPAA